jgi:hypothetical protein
MAKTALGRKSLVVLLGLTMAACEGASLDSPLPDTDPETDGAKDTTEVQSALTGDIWSTVKDMTFDWDDMSGMTKFVVPNGGSFEAWTEATGNVDPALVAFRRTSGTSTAFLTAIVAQNDSRSSGRKNARIEWTNTLGINPTVYVLVYANNWDGRGTTRVKYRLPDGTTETSEGVWAHAVPLYDNNVPVGPPFGCSSANASRIQLTRIQGSGGFGHTVIAVNMTTMRGGYITDTPLTLTQTLQLTDVLPSGGNSFMLGFVWGRDPHFPPNACQALQQNRRTCTIFP